MKKIALLILAVVLALGTLGVGYAKWTDSVSVKANVGTDSVGICFDSIFTSDPCTIGGPGTGTVDQGGLGSTCVPLVFSRRAPAEQKDVACTSAAALDCHTMSVTVNNAYPYYEASVDWSICNTGSVPVKIQNVVITDDFGHSYVLVASGNQPLDLNNDGCCDFIFNFGDNFGAQIHPDECADESLAFVLLECLTQNTQNLHFSLSINVIQWNEY